MFCFYEFFAGVGLARLGLKGWTCLWANDIDLRKAEVYEANFGSGEYLVGDIAAVTVDQLPPRADMAWASFPCQDLSLAGWRRGMGAERSGTFWPFWRLLRDLYDKGDRPPIIVLENVTGLLYGQDFAGLCEALASLGLQFGALVINASQFLPQSRPRVFIVAVDARVDVQPWLEPEPEMAPWFPKAVWSAWRSLPQPVQELWRWWRLPEPTLAIPQVADLIETEPTGVRWDSPAETERLLEMMSLPNRQKIEQAQLSGERSVGLLYKRTRNGVQRAEIRFDMAGCLRTPNGGSSRQTVVLVEDNQIRSRLLSPREAARLMGVPDSFWLPPHYNNGYRAMGDGVAVPVVAWLSQHLLLPLATFCKGYSIDLRGHSGVSQLYRSRELAEEWADRWREAHRQVAASK